MSPRVPASVVALVHHTDAFRHIPLINSVIRPVDDHRVCDKWPQILDALHLTVLERGCVPLAAVMKNLLNGTDKTAKSESCDRKKGTRRCAISR
ncbi:uncharacterized protein SCHCODRAFT_01129955 [Schizophyllum commune H4-8]|uniref:Expressed protein n=1 Tax=Schizophyllum commune (strain H4-8 / FGSC 9210) TaxID=578458 RepID=D8QAU9_SCHCM|nr:uncharacterized protein SCHCODRAFT_01129955 [Schizophyllum commune H4-8]KAI5888917.1 hypothetical protein SCHCODRAFT_01129955 [Schizophyllum commune H4-8]